MPNFKNERPGGGLYGLRNPLGIPKVKIGDKEKLVAARVNRGMITMIDPADIDPSALQLARNARCRFDKLTRRPGTILFTPAKPNSNAVIGFGFFKKNNGETYFIRFTRNSLHYLNAGAWTNIPAGVGGSLLGSDTDRFQSITVLDRFVFANNGVDVLQEAIPTTPEFVPLGNAPEYKYITGFFNRVVGANLGGSSPNGAQIGWSGDANIDEWDPLTDETAGNTPLVESPADLGDYINGVFGFTNVMVILRERSIWQATKQPIPTNPFNFYTAFPGLGCDCPDSAAVTLNGITWVDQRSGSVWMYQPGSAPEPIGRAIEKDLMTGLDDPRLVFGSYAPIENEYTVCIPRVGHGGVTAWTYNFRTQAWTRDEYEIATAIDDIDLAVAGITIDDLGDVPIDSLVGTIDSLSPGSDIIPVRLLGRSDGEIIIEDEESYTDPTVSGSANTTGEFLTEIISKAFALEKDDAYFAEVRIEYVPLAPAQMTLSYSRDGGVTFNTLTKTYTPTPDQIGKPQIFRWVKQVKARRFSFKLAFTNGQFEVTGYEVHIYPGGESRT